MLNKKDLSIVTTLYNSAPYLNEFYERCVKTALKITTDFEIIFINDGSPDDSLGRALTLQRADPRVTVVDLSRNFGHHRAMMFGLSRAKGKKVFLIDSDLEEEPEILERFNEEFKNGSIDAVYGVQQSRKGGLFERLSGALFYKLFNFLSSHPIPENLTTVRLMSARFVKALLQYQEREVFAHGLWSMVGFKQAGILIQKHGRDTSTYTLTKKCALFVNAITSFSDRPLIFIFYLGGLISIMTGFYICYLVYLSLLRGIPVQGWASILVSTWFLGGLIIFFIGVIGIYLSKIFNETKNRPYVTIKDVYPPSAGTE